MIKSKRYNEYQLLGNAKNQAIYILRFCPMCGSRLPDSTRANHFTAIREDDAAAIRKRLNGLETIDEVIKELGKPDDILGPNKALAKKAKAYSIKHGLHDYVYTRLSTSFILTVRQVGMHSIRFVFLPKEKQ